MGRSTDLRGRLTAVYGALALLVFGLALAGAATRQGGPGDDRLLGTRAADRIFGRGGDDVLQGKRGADLLLGGRGDDVLSGGRGGDRLRAGGGADIVKAGAGDDRLAGARGDDRLLGGAGDDRVRAGYGRDEIGARHGVEVGSPGDDVIHARDGEPDVIHCGAGHDKVFVDRVEDGVIDCEVVKEPKGDG